ncbi:MAG TPA: hypothetical protein VJP86_02470 [Vicinamibacterales bacterium]|jgi:Flp pilus assembly pilin Flp|nr:hypothetical protein [Vicinamibacterales bacterium]
MARALVVVAQLVKDDKGQDLIEYCLLTALVAIAVLVAVRSVGETMNAVWWGPIADAF